MSLKQALLETIYEEWIYNPVKFETVYIHKSLVDAIKNSGDEVPCEFDLQKFDKESIDKFPTLKIEIGEQDNLINYGYFGYLR